MGIIDNAKEVAQLVQKVGDTELYRKIVELEGEIIELTREKRELEDELEKVRASQAVIAELIFDSPFYRTEDGTELYCARCIEADGKAIHVVHSIGIELRGRVWRCPECRTEYKDTR